MDYCTTATLKNGDVIDVVVVIDAEVDHVRGSYRRDEVSSDDYYGYSEIVSIDYTIYLDSGTDEVIDPADLDDFSAFNEKVEQYVLEYSE